MDYEALQAYAQRLGGTLDTIGGSYIVTLPTEKWTLSRLDIVQDVLEIYEEEQFDKLLTGIEIDL
jgi:hypothetical protein